MNKCNSILYCIYLFNCAVLISSCTATKQYPYTENPLQSLYDEVSNTDSIWIKDSDHDGVLDRNDKEPNTVEFAAVNFNGVTIDSDKDGCFDYEDPEPFSFFSGSINNCSDNQLIDTLNYPPLEWLRFKSEWMLPTIFFKPEVTQITKSQENELNYLIEILETYPQMKVHITGVMPFEKNDTITKQKEIWRIRNTSEYLLKNNIPGEWLSIILYSEQNGFSTFNEELKNRIAFKVSW